MGLAKPPCCHDAGGLLHHRFSFSLNGRARQWESSFLRRFPSGYPAWPLASILPCGARTFLMARDCSRAPRSSGPPRASDCSTRAAVPQQGPSSCYDFEQFAAPAPGLANPAFNQEGTAHDHGLQAPPAHRKGDPRGHAALRRAHRQEGRVRRPSERHHHRRRRPQAAHHRPLLGRPRGLGARLHGPPRKALRARERPPAHLPARLHQQAAHQGHRLQGPAPQPRPGGPGRPARGHQGRAPHAPARHRGERLLHRRRDALPLQLPVPR